MITNSNLISPNKEGFRAVQAYRQKMGEEAFNAYNQSLFTFIDNMSVDSEIRINDVVKANNEDLFAKCICRFVFLECFNLQFSADFTRLRKFEKKN